MIIDKMTEAVTNEGYTFQPSYTPTLPLLPSYTPTLPLLCPITQPNDLNQMNSNLVAHGIDSLPWLRV